jgi:hypothetical protein
MFNSITLERRLLPQPSPDRSGILFLFLVIKFDLGCKRYEKKKDIADSGLEW